MNPMHQFQRLGTLQLNFDGALAMLRQQRVELQRNRQLAENWGLLAVGANVVLIPLNVIVNGMDLGAVNSVYQMVVREVYGKFARSGSRGDGHAKTALALLKKAIAEELKRKGATQYVPGVNILVGLAEDTLAAVQTAAMVQDGRHEASRLAHALDRQIQATERALQQVGIRRAELLDLALRVGRTA